MKKLISLCLVICLVLSIISCGYEPVKSTEKESTTVMTMTLDRENYEVKYELYRAFFLTLKKVVDGGDSSVWSGENKNEYIEKIDSLIKERIASIYATIHTAKMIGFDVMGKDYDEKVAEYIEKIVDTPLEEGGFDEDYDAYLSSLKDKFHNYSTADLLIRYALATDEVINYYTPSIEGEDGEISYTDTDLRNFYFGDNSARVLKVFLDSSIWTEQRAKEARDSIAKLTTEDSVAIAMINLITTGGTDIKNGSIVTKYNYDELYYSEFTETVMSLSDYELSEPIFVNTGESSGYYIIYKAAKSEENFVNLYEHIAESFVDDAIGKILSDAKDALLTLLTYTENLTSLDRANIKMD
jgi:hypothetical protein